MMIGDWFRKPGKGWHVTCYFTNAENQIIRKGVPVDLLPALTTGTTYPRTSTENKAKGYTGTFGLPEMSNWYKCQYSDLPSSLKRLYEVSDQIDNQVLFRIEDSIRTYWLPISELARMLYFQSSEVVRAAVYEGNTWQLAKATEEDWIGKIELSSNVPLSYLNSIQFRKFFAWLMFNDSVEDSFGSIFTHLNRETQLLDSSERWTFDFDPPDLGGVEMSWVGYTGSVELNEKHHCYIREIRGLAGLPAPNLDSIWFSHPDDTLFIEGDQDSNDPDEPKPPKPRKPQGEPNTIDPDNPPKGNKRRYLLKVTSSGFHFDTEIDLRRSPRQVNALPKGEIPDLEEEQEDDSPVGLEEGEMDGKNRRGDVNNLEEKDPVEAPEKIALFQSMLEELAKQHPWEVTSEIGEVPKMRCRSAHLVEGRARKYCYAKVVRDETTVVHVIEIELTKNESLSTFFFRAKNADSVRTTILESLMTSDSLLNHKSMQWKRKINAESTISRYYLEHPDKKVLSDAEALESWVVRAADRINSL